MGRKNGASMMPRFKILGCTINQLGLAGVYATVALVLLIFTAAGAGLSRAASIQYAVLYSWVVVFLKALLSFLGKPFGQSGQLLAPSLFAIGFVVLSTLLVILYLLLLAIIRKMIYRYSQVGGLISPCLLHFLGSYFALPKLDPLQTWTLGRESGPLFFIGIIFSLAIVLLYYYCSWNIIKEAS